MTHLRLWPDRVIDGRSAQPLEGQTVTTEDSRIVGVGPVDATPTPDADVLDVELPGCTLLPGLIDVHAHLTFGTPSRTYEQVMREDSDDLMLIRAVRNCQLHLAAGVTTVRDCGARNRTTLSLRDAAQLGLFPAPRLLVSGPPLTMTGGHFWWCNGEADGVEGVQLQARWLLKQGVDFLKIMASGGGTVGTNQARASYTVDEIRAAVQEAHRVNKLTTAHCLAAESLANAVDAGIDQVEHINFIQPDGSRRFDREVADRIVQRNIYVSPTIQTGYHELERLSSRSDLNEPEQRQLDDLNYKLETKLDFVRRFHEMGARIVAGTDAIAAFGDYAIGLTLLQRAGIPHMQVIQAATRVAAEAIGIGATVGTIEVGKEADLVACRGNPLTDIRCLNDVVMVVRAGKVVSRPAVP
ncbi:MAG TPA: amidohydrolase family protein [Chloroflexota bacterium]